MTATTASLGLWRSTKQRPIEERFWEKVDAFGDCWEWLGGKNERGYGRFCPTRTAPTYAHRFAWETLIGPIPDGMVIDHLCENRSCVNPAHLRVTTQRENTLRGRGLSAQNARMTHCRYGHPLAGHNLVHRTHKQFRRCRTCEQNSMRAFRAARKGVAR